MGKHHSPNHSPNLCHILGPILDNTLGMEKQVNYICKSRYYRIRNTGLIRKYINDETCRTLVRDFIISRLDYDNDRLYNIPLSLWQTVYSEWRTVLLVWWHVLEKGNIWHQFCTRKGEHITLVLFQLHWLPVRFRSCFINSIIEWNSTTVSKRSARKTYTRENAPIWVKKAIQ